MNLNLFGVKWKKLGDISNISRGASPRPIRKYITEDSNGVPWIKIGDSSLNSKYIFSTNEKITDEGAKKSRVLKSGSLILSNSMSYGRPYILKLDGAIHDGWASISNYEKYLSADFLYYYLSTSSVNKFWKFKINSATVSNLNSNIIASLNVPIPPREVQDYVVGILDKFDAIVNDICEGLPREIELRQKQYEYYRDKLLDFER